jgi:hypothetical protein
MHIRRTVRATVGRIGAVTYPSRIVIPAAFLIPMEDDEALDAIMWREETIGVSFGQSTHITNCAFTSRIRWLRLTT